MDFKTVLNNYIQTIHCNSKELAQSSSLSPAAISRYRKGARIPDYNSKQFLSIIDGLYILANEKKIENITKEQLLDSFKEVYGNNAIDFDIVRGNLNTLISELNINISQLAKALGFDSSYFSRICSGKRKPADVDGFIDSISNYIYKKYSNNQEKISVIISTDTNNQISTLDIKEWLLKKNIENDSSINNFLEKLNDFDLVEYIKAIHFDSLKVPTIPFQFSNSKQYFGLKELKNGELDFFKATVLSKKNEPLFMFNDMPMEDQATDIEFGKKWMFAIAMSLKKGLHLNMVHNLDRPFNELLLGLESWIPIYMTGQITPYYFKQPNSDLFYHTLYVSGAAALSGEGIKGQHSKCSYYLTNKKNELEYFTSRAKALLKKASPLMDIYNEENMNDYNTFLEKELKNPKNEIIKLENKELYNTFKNIEFTICKNKWILLTKKNGSPIHFVIYHPKLRNAIENYITPIIENK